MSVSTLGQADNRKSDDVSESKKDEVVLSAPDNLESDWYHTALELPDVSGGTAYAVSARAAGRLNAAVVKDEEINSLLSERQSLLDKKFAGAITPSEENKLAYIRWSFDRIEDAKNGPMLDIIESQVEIYENFVQEINKFYEQLNRISYSRPRR